MSEPQVECDGCRRPGADRTLWLAAPLGLTAVHVHEIRACAEQAREQRGGGRFLTGPPMPRVERERYPTAA